MTKGWIWNPGKFPSFCPAVLKMYNFGQIPSAILVDWAVFRTSLDFTKMWTRWNFESIFLKIVRQKGLFDAIKENPNFPHCRRILDIYWQWLLNWILTGKNLSLFYQITKGTDHFQKPFMHVFKFSLVDVQLIKRGIKENETLQAYWIRPSKTAQSQGCLFAFFSTPIFKKCLGPYCSFLLPKTSWRTDISATKSLFPILRKTDEAKVSSTNFRETLQPTASLVCCQFDM